MPQRKSPNDRIRIDLRDIIIVLLYVIEIALLLPFLDAGLNALNQPSTISFISGVIWCCFIVTIFIVIVRSRLNNRIAHSVISLFEK